MLELLQTLIYIFFSFLFGVIKWSYCGNVTLWNKMDEYFSSSLSKNCTLNCQTKMKNRILSKFLYWNVKFENTKFDTIESTYPKIQIQVNYMYIVSTCTYNCFLQYSYACTSYIQFLEYRYWKEDQSGLSGYNEYTCECSTSWKNKFIITVYLN